MQVKSSMRLRVKNVRNEAHKSLSLMIAAKPAEQSRADVPLSLPCRRTPKSPPVILSTFHHPSHDTNQTPSLPPIHPEITLMLRKKKEEWN